MIHAFFFLFTVFVGHCFSHETSAVYHSVNVITGDYCEAENDMKAGSSPLLMRRIYSEQGWLFNHPNVFAKNTDKIADVNQERTKIAYHYDDLDRLSMIQSKRNADDKVEGWMHLFYPDNSVCQVNAHDGQFVIYHCNSEGLLEEVVRPGGQSCKYQYRDHPTLSKKKLITKRECAGICLEIEYYDQSDANSGKVKLQKAPVGPNGEMEITHRFVYYDGFTEVYDALDHKIIYRHVDQHLTAIELYDEENHLYRIESFLWKQQKIHARTISDGQGQVWMCQGYQYDSNGNCIGETLYGNLTGKQCESLRIGVDGIPEGDCEKYSTKYFYSEQHPHLVVKQVEDNGTTTHFHYQNGSQIAAKLIESDGVIRIRHFYKYNTLGDVVETIIDDGSSFDQHNLIDVTERHITKLKLRTEHPGLGLPEVVEEYSLDVKTGNENLVKKVTNTYSVRGEILQQDEFDSDGVLKSSRTRSYNHTGALLTSKDENGGIENSYDSLGRLVHTQTVGTACKGKSTAYDAVGRVIKIEESSEGRKESLAYRYDELGNQLSSIDTYGNATHYSYDAFGRIVETVLPLVLDENGQQIHPKERKEYDIFNRCTAVINANGDCTRTRYNVRGKPVEVIYPNGTVEKFEYTLDGTLKKTVGRDNISVVYHHDYLARVTRKDIFNRSGEFHTSASAIYSAFQLLAMTDAAGHTISSQKSEETESKELKKPEKIRPESHYSFCYNDRGQQVQQVSMVDDSGCLTIVTFDALKRAETLVKKDQIGLEVCREEYRYDLVGNKVREEHAILINGKQAGSYVVKWQYGPERRLESITEAANTQNQAKTTYLYDSAGKLQHVVKPDGVSLSYEYDDMGRVQRFYSSDNTIDYHYTYDVNNRVVAIEDCISGTLTQREYSGSQLIQEVLANQLVMKNGYDDANRRTSLILPDNSAIEYEYDQHHLKTVHRKSAQKNILYSHRYEYDEKGNVLSTDMIGGLGKINYQYDQFNHCIDISSPYWSQQITRNGKFKVSQLVTRDFSGENLSKFDYDSLNQLTNESGSFSNTYSYDSIANRLSQNQSQCTIDKRNRLISVGNSAYTYDANGCLTEKTAKEKTTKYHYDALNRLVGVICDGVEIKYIYDAFNRRLTKSKNGVQELRYLYDGNNEIGAVDNQGRIRELRVLGRGLGAEIGAAISLEIDNRMYAPIHDHRGDICCLVSLEERSVTECYRYSAFGQKEIYNASGECIPTSACKNPWQFSSKRMDEDTGLINYGKRYYDSETGRWTTPDPLGVIDGPNVYAYVGNNPMALQDLYGLYSWWDFWDGVVSVVTTVCDAINSAVTYLQEHFSYMSYAKSDIDFTMEAIFGKGFLAMTGYYADYPDVGVHGHGELNDKVRITCINGILNMRPDWISSVKEMSELHGGMNVHYVLYPTEGWTMDLVLATMAKCGFKSAHTHLLADTWKQMIQEMGGTDSGGLIIHYAHSIGGTNTMLATDLLTPEEQKMIKVITLGTATMVPSTGFHSAINYVSYRDGVSLTDPVGFVSGLLFNDTNIIFAGTIFGVPLIDHMLSQETYRRALEMFGKQFVEAYLLNQL